MIPIPFFFFLFFFFIFSLHNRKKKKEETLRRNWRNIKAAEKTQGETCGDTRRDGRKQFANLGKIILSESR